MRFDVITLFSQMFAAVTESGITRRALEQNIWQFETWNPRDFTTDVHRTVDDRPFGGGPGMVLMAEPLALALQAAKAQQKECGLEGARVIALSASGTKFTDQKARALAAAGTPLILVCGRYEGIDQRFIDQCVDEELSIGDFVISGGELAAMVLIDAVVRHLPGTMKALSSADESFAHDLLDAPQYTRPVVWRGQAVPDVLLSGHHAQIEQWRQTQKSKRTHMRRPDLLVDRKS